MNAAILVVDVRNVYYCVSQKFGGRKLDYEKLMDLAKQFGFVKQALAYGGSIGSEAVHFITYLKALGYETKYKELKPDELDEKKTKRADWSVGLTMDIVKAVLSQRLDCVIIVTSSPDYIPLVTWVRERGIRVIVIGSGIPKELREAASSSIEIYKELLQHATIMESDKKDGGEGGSQGQ
jgi:uncharacterized LabA/DUF88 family protein